MRRAGRFPGDQAEIVFTDKLIEQLDDLTREQQENVLAEIVVLCEAPGGKHPLSGLLAGWNTLDVLSRQHRVIYKATIVDGTGLLEVLCLGPRSDDEVYDMAVGLTDSGLLAPDEVTDLWDALAVLAVVSEDVGLDGWDYRPPAAPVGMQRAAVAAGVIDAETAALLSKPELEAAIEGAWAGEGPTPDPEAALVAALERARSNARYPGRDVVRRRQEPRCDVQMPRANARCVRRRGHPGPHRAR